MHEVKTNPVIGYGHGHGHGHRVAWSGSGHGPFGYRLDNDSIRDIERR